MSIDQLKQRLAEYFSYERAVTEADKLLLDCRTALEQQEQEEVRRIKHLNRLATWAQQDPTGPICAGGIQQWVLAELKAALGSKYEPSAFQPSSHQYEQLESQLLERDAQAAAMRECLTTLLHSKFGGFWKPIQDALSTTAGKSLLERLQKAEGELAEEKKYSEGLATDICKMEDVLGFKQDQHDKDGAFVPTIGPWLERVRDLLANEGELGDLKDRLQAVEKALRDTIEAFETGRSRVYTNFGHVPEATRAADWIWIAMGDSLKTARTLLQSEALQPKDSQ